ncbi:HpcH/HpaI aldolase family protein [Pseudonocardia pini]|uniref:HpcH/HpaI aldolase family protein n=1 Tax=Pseudonocardia pini TaxID=2758030 RepID=UPI0015F035BF|nr:aldolase/citrate lyase family protein [Pseudonocardia pini]
MVRPTRRKSMRARLDEGETLVGTLHDFVDPALIEIVGWVGYDYVVLEHEHGLRSLESIQNLIRAAEAAGLDTIVRVGTTAPALIQQILEAGATGVMVAHVRTAEDAETIVRAARYAPRGTRGEGYTRNGRLWEIGPGTTALHEQADHEAIVLAIIEDPEGVENIEAIVRTPGLTGIAPGYADLATGLGGVPLDSPEVLDRMAHVIKAVNAQPEVRMLSMVQDAASIPGIIEEGNQLVLWNHDVILVGNLYKKLLDDTRAALGQGDGA